jgi:deazaflavin-dependent oxidoreductase (nitroreductase family)
VASAIGKNTASVARKSARFQPYARCSTVASKGGAPQHPGWYRNILANPEVEVQVGTAKLKARARIATGDERARLREKALEFWPPYANYQRKTEREIPIVVLDPVG